MVREGWSGGGMCGGICCRGVVLVGGRGSRKVVPAGLPGF